MIKVEVTDEFTLKEFYKIKDTLVRKTRSQDGKLFPGDTFECDQKMLSYLTGDNKYNKTFVKVIEVEPEKAFVLGDKEEEHVIPLRDKEELDKLGEEILKKVQEVSADDLDMKTDKPKKSTKKKNKLISK